MWGHPYTDRVCTIPLVGELDLAWTQVTSFLRVCWQLSPGRGGARDAGARDGVRCEVGLLCSVAITALSGRGLIPSC